jgi:hypothetical protein
MADVRSRALGYLRDGAVAVFHARSPRDGTPPHELVAKVEGHHGRYIVDFLDGTWTCTCCKPACAHLAAVQLVTGHTSPAAKAVAS